MLYIYLGENSFEKELAVHRLRQNVGLKLESVYADQGMQPWFERLGQADLFGEEEGGLIGRDQLEQWPAGQLEQLWGHLLKQQALTPKGPIVVLLGQKAEVKKLSEWLADYKQTGQETAAQVEQFELLNEVQLGRWLGNMARSMKLDLKPGLAKELAERLAGNQFALLNQLRQWQTRGRSVIEAADLEVVSPVDRDREVFGLLEAWLHKRLAEALKEYYLLSEDGSEMGPVVGMLSWQLELLRYCLVEREAGGGRREAGFKAYSLAKTRKAARLWTLAEVDRAIEGLVDVDERVKTGGGVVGLEGWIWRSISGG